MEGPRKKGKSDSTGEVRSSGTPAEKARPWTQEEMEAAEPYPMPEVRDDETEASDVATRLITDVHVSHDDMEVDLSDGTTVCLSLRDFPSLFQAPREQRDQWSVIRGGTAIRWNTLGEELSLEAILTRGR